MTRLAEPDLAETPVPESAPGGRWSETGRRLRRLMPAPLWVLLLVLLLTLAGTLTVLALVRQQQEARFEREITAYQRDLRQRFQGYTGLLIAVRAAWEAVEAMQPGRSAALAAPALSPQQFERLARGLNLSTRFPGLSSLGYAPLVAATERGGFARRLPLIAGDPGVRLHPSSQQPWSAPVVYLAPSGSDRSVLGYDMYSDPVRRQAIQEAARSGEIQATRQIELLNLPLGAADRTGLILYLPVRSGGEVTGLLFAPLRISAVLPSQSAAGRNRIDLKIDLGGQGVAQPDSPGPGESDPADSGFHQTETLNLAGQDWTLTFSAAPNFGQDAAAGTPWLVLVTGSLVGVLAALATRAQVQARLRAEQVSRSLSLSRTRLERARAEFEAVFQAMQDTAVFTDLSGRVLFANAALKESFGLSPVELRGTPLERLHADPLLLERLDRLPGPHLVTTLFRRQDRLGELFYGEMQRSRVTGEGGEPLGQLEVIRDISERLQADRAVRQGERRYQGVLEGMPQIVFLTDAAGRVSYLNRRWQDYVGALPGLVLPMPGPETAAQPGPLPDWRGVMLRAIHPDDRGEFSRRWQEALASGRELEVEHRLRSDSGLYRTFMTRGRPVRDAQGQVQEWVVSSTDIDDQIASETNARLLADVGQALSDRHLPDAAGDAQAAWADDRGLRQALNLMTLRFADSAALWPSPEPGDATAPANWPSPLMAGRAGRIGLTESGLLARINEAVAGVIGRHEPGLFQGEPLHSMGLSSAVLLPLMQGESPLGVLGLGFRQPLQDRDLELARELGQRLSSALDNRQLLGRLQATRASLEDLNGSLEGRVAERTLQLSEANSELEAFSYSVSHDLRTPLRHIMGFADLLGREIARTEASPGGSPAAGPVTPKAARYLNVITESAGRMNQLIDDLLEFSRTSRAELRRQPVDLGEVVRGAVQRLAPDQGERTVEWRVQPLPTVIGDPGLLRQVFDNLLSNALKYTRTRPEAVIEVAAQPHEREVWLSVRDNGVGFDPEYAGKLFGVFQRLHRNEEFEGTGIGLANVRRIVSRHGGRVWAKSGQEGQTGATFWVALPLEALSLRKNSRPSQAGEPGTERQPSRPAAERQEVQP